MQETKRKTEIETESREKNRMKKRDSNNYDNLFFPIL